MFSASIGLLVFLMFLFFAMQVMFGLYATSTLRATLNDTVARANGGRRRGGPAELRAIAADAEGSLGEMGQRQPSTVVEAVDEDGDGVPDVVVGRAVAVRRLRAPVDRRADQLRAGHRRCPGPDRAGALAPVETAVAPARYCG